MAKIIIIGSYAPFLINFRGPLLEAMVKKGHTVFACAPSASNEIKDRLKEMGVIYQDIYIDRTGINPVRDIKTILSFILLFKKLKPDFVLSYTVKPVLYGSIGAKMCGIPHIFSMITGAGYLFSGNSLKQKIIGFIARTLYKVSLRFNKKVFFQNPDDCNMYYQLGLLKAQNQAILINGSGVDIDYYYPVPLPDNISFLLIARLLYDKGLVEYVNAARIIKQKHPEITFTLVGWIDDNPNSIRKSDLQRWIDDGIIEYLGRLEDVRPAIAASSVYVLPSYYREGTPRTILEAMAMGRPIITTDAPGCRETVIEGQNGFLIPVKNVDALVGAIKKFINDNSLIKKMGQESRKIAMEKYDVKKVNEVILETMGLKN